MEAYLKTAELAARAAGQIIMEGLGKLTQEDIASKRSNDFVTVIDKRAEEAVVDIIRGRFPRHSFKAEEGSGKAASKRGEPTWIIDPLDGTTNFIHGFPVFSVSIALMEEGALQVGVVHDPARGETFMATRGGGAFVDGKPLRVSDIKELKGSLITTGFPFRDPSMIEPTLDLLRQLFMATSGIRRPGSAALDLAYTAAGRCEGFYEYGLNAWDIAAGSLLVMEAGGLVTDFAGEAGYLETGNIVAGNPHIQPVILSHVRNAFGGAGVLK